MIKKILVLFFFFFLVNNVLRASTEIQDLNMKMKGENVAIEIVFNHVINKSSIFYLNQDNLVFSLDDKIKYKNIKKNIQSDKGLITSYTYTKNNKTYIRVKLPQNFSGSKDDVTLMWNQNKLEVFFPQSLISNKLEKTTAQVKPIIKEKKEVPTSPTAKVLKSELNENYLARLENESARKILNEKANNKPKLEIKKSTKKDSLNTIQSTTKKQLSSSGFSWGEYAFKFLGFLIVVLGAFYGLAHLFKKGFQKSNKLNFLKNSNSVQILTTTYLAPKKSLHTIKVQNQVFLISASDSGVQFLAEIKDTVGFIKEGEKLVSGENFDSNLLTKESEEITRPSKVKMKENIYESQRFDNNSAIGKVSSKTKDIVRFSEELKKKARNLKPLENS